MDLCLRDVLADWCFTHCPLILADDATFESLVRLVHSLLLEILRRERADEQGTALFHAACRELLQREKRLYVLDGMSDAAAERAAERNLALRRREMEDELLGIIDYHAARYLRRLRELAAMQADRREFPPDGAA